MSSRHGFLVYRGKQGNTPRGKLGHEARSLRVGRLCGCREIATICMASVRDLRLPRSTDAGGREGVSRGIAPAAQVVSLGWVFTAVNHSHATTVVPRRTRARTGLSLYGSRQSTTPSWARMRSYSLGPGDGDGESTEIARWEPEVVYRGKPQARFRRRTLFGTDPLRSTRRPCWFTAVNQGAGTNRCTDTRPKRASWSRRRICR